MSLSAGRRRIVASGRFASLGRLSIFWAAAIDWAGFHIEPIGRLLHPQPTELVRDGVLNRKNLRGNMITVEELMTHVRQAGTDELSRVQRALLEGNGEISVILAE